ncbi:MAG TPA: DinB family protein [Dehalococcoidia bacterium]|jgi:hypothetical protein|nr:DinB family protein [Dehalococcoidia bacterium]
MDAFKIDTRYCTICEAERKVPSPVLDGMSRAPELIAEAIASSTEAWGEGWSTREVAAHLADSEIGFGWRIRQILTQDEPLIASYDEEAFARVFFYARRDVAIALDAFRAVRAANVEILRGAGEAAWGRAYRQGETRRTLGELVWHRADHDLQHVRQIMARA